MALRRPRFARCDLVIGAIALIGLGIGGCRSAPRRHASLLTPESVRDAGLLRSAERLWRAKLDHDWVTVARMQSPTGTVDEAAVKPSELLVVKYKLGDAWRQKDRGWVNVDFTTRMARFPDIPPRSVRIWQKWRLKNEQWRPVPPDELDDYPVVPLLRDRVQEAALQERFDVSWNARLHKNWEALYQMTDPRDRADVPFEEFLKGEHLIDYLSHKVEWIEVIGDRGRVRVQYHHRLADPSLTKLPPATIAVTELWVRRDDVWYRDLNPQ